MPDDSLRALPSVERLLATPVAVKLAEEISREQVRDLLREITAEIRQEILSGSPGRRDGAGDGVDAGNLEREIELRLARKADEISRPSLRRVINATGVITHTNLGRAPLARAAIEAVADIAAHYSNLEYDLTAGTRGRRETHCNELISRLTGSESAIVANNNAAAVMLVLNTLAEGGEVIVSRGELIEIGGSFRIPDVMQKSGARLSEVGTTNRTRIADYEKAINQNTRLILRVHPSNYRIVGFTDRPGVHEIAELARRAGIPSYEDLGSGCLIDLAPFGIPGEPVVRESLNAGISVVSFSGDKMMGGPQAGIIAGSRPVIDAVRKNPLMRALRVDKMTYSALEGTLRLYERGLAISEVPIVRAIAWTRDEIAERAERFVQGVPPGGVLRATLEDGASVIGGGAAPGVELPTLLVALESEDLSAASIETRLRQNAIPIICRTDHDAVLIDLRTVMPGEESIVLEAIVAISIIEAGQTASAEV
jgi:L-seryl-tRNA(Ser) seleniumtransferase